MALPPLHWKFVGVGTHAGGIANFIQALTLLGQSTLYADGTARVPGTSSAWTWTGAATYSVGAPPNDNPLYPNTYTMRYIVAGDGVGTPAAYAAPDTSTPARLSTVWMGANKGVASIVNAWNAAQPFGSGFTGYWSGIPGPVAGSIYMYESEEACVIVRANSDGACVFLLFGALFDPLASSGVESNGRLYFMQSAGSAGGSSFINADFLSQATRGVLSSSWGCNSTNSGEPHCAYITPGSSSITALTAVVRLERFYAANAWANPGTSPAGYPILSPFSLVTTNTGTFAFIGIGRQAYAGGGHPCGTVIKSGASVVGYSIAQSTLSSNDAVVLAVV